MSFYNKLLEENLKTNFLCYDWFYLFLRLILRPFSTEKIQFLINFWLLYSEFMKDTFPETFPKYFCYCINSWKFVIFHKI